MVHLLGVGMLHGLPCADDTLVPEVGLVVHL